MKKFILLFIFFIAVFVLSLLLVKIPHPIIPTPTDSTKTNQSPDQPQYFLNQAKNMTLEEKLRQVLVCGYDGPIVQKALDLSHTCGNFLLLQENIKGLSENQITANNIAIHQNDHLAWIMVDQEGGRVSLGKETSPSAKIMGDTNTAFFWGDTYGKFLKSLDIDVNLAPVADISDQSPVIGDRSFADNPESVSLNVVGYLQALQKNGIIAVVKHLPGHGRVLSDTHNNLGKLKYSWETIKSYDLIPFIEASNNGAEIFMIGHIIVPELDTKPASISQNIIQKLRQTLPRGSNLLFITDSLSMEGVGTSEEKAAIEALKAGADLLILQSDSIPKTYLKILENYHTGNLSPDQLIVSVAKILQLKARFGRI